MLTRSPASASNRCKPPANAGALWAGENTSGYLSANSHSDRNKKNSDKVGEKCDINKSLSSINRSRSIRHSSNTSGFGLKIRTEGRLPTTSVRSRSIQSEEIPVRTLWSLLLLLQAASKIYNSASASSWKITRGLSKAKTGIAVDFLRSGLARAVLVIERRRNSVIRIKRSVTNTRASILLRPLCKASPAVTATTANSHFNTVSYTRLYTSSTVKPAIILS